MENKVILVSIDGMRPDGVLQCGHPFVEEMMRLGSYTLDARTVVPSVTLPCHMSMFHSVPPTRHGIGTNTCRSLRSEVFVPGREKQKGDKVELGNLTWALFVCYTLCRTTLEEEMLTETVLPLLAGAVKYYTHFLTPDEKGILHLAPTESPEYLAVDEDTNYDLALLRWGLETLIGEHTRLGGDARIAE